MKIIKWLSLSVLLLLGAFAFWIYTSTYHPDDVQQEPVVSPDTTARLQAGQRVSVLSWNVQFMAGNADNHFFYDDGPDPWPSADRVEQTIAKVAAFIQQQDPDLVLLQEVDDLADRTHLRDQSAALRARLPQYKAFTETFYWKADYVPHPAINGRVGMKLVVLSKYALSDATRFALPMITTDDILRRQFNLKRAMQQVTLPVDGGNELVVINTHLSAFAKGSDTMQRQVETVMARLARLPQDSPWVLAGDFNLLPNEAALESFEESRSHYNDKGTELVPLISRYPSLPALSDIERSPESWYTYMPPTDPEREPDRTIDYIFYSPLVTLVEGAVIQGNAKPLSDHLPLQLTFTLPGQTE